MAKSNYGQIKKYENEILAMKEAGYTKRRIAEELALTKEQIKEFLKRHRRRERKIEVGIPVRSQGRSSNYIYFYNHQRIQLKTGVAPLMLRHYAENLIFPT